MNDLVVDPRFWGAAAAALFVGFLAGLLICALLHGNDRPEVVGAIRKRCRACKDGWAIGDMGLCRSCQQSFDDEGGAT